MRVATWNLKQAVAPRAKLPDLWRWLETEVAPDVAVLTEAKVPKDGPPPGWTAQWLDGGFGPRRRWGTVLAGRGVELRRVDSVKRGLRRHAVASHWPAAVQVADVLVRGERWATLVGLYGVLEDVDGNKQGNGVRSTRHVLAELEPVLGSALGDRIVVAGDLNLWPNHVPRGFADAGLVDLIDHTRADRPRLGGCSGCDRGADCGHMWTHANPGGRNPAKQQIDFVFASRALVRELSAVTGGIRDFPGAWQVSDHAPVVADFTF